jgi:spermidine synthase
MWRLLLISSAALYLEIVLIRWLGTEVKIFAFFQNLTLIVCFLGFGVGCFSSSKRGSLWPSLAAITTMVVIVSLPFQAWHNLLKDMSSILSFTTDAQLWATMRVSASAYPRFLVLSLGIVAVFLMLLAIAMIPLGRWVGHYLESAPNTVGAYSVNLVGSLVGIWLLAVLAFLWLSPSYWFVAVFVLVVLSQPISWRSACIAGGLLAITLLALRIGGGSSDFWSPYQKLSVTDMGDHQFLIDVNNEGYMSIANVTPEYLAKNPQFANSYQESSYDSPFLFTKNVDRVLVVGSGAGNDIAAALRHGASRVDAVEIDPLISTMGTRLHPEHPYSSPKVHLINNDARNFMRNCQDKYDVIIFGLLDSHTEFSGYSNMRVDNYVYTQESFRDARRLLNTDGTLILKFEVRGPWSWMGQRFYSMLSGIFPHPPLTYYASEAGALLHATVFIESDSPAILEKSLGAQEATFLKAHPPEFVPSNENAPTPTTDDWPYVYHRGRTIPRTYFVVSAVILALTFYLVGPFFKPKESSTWQFFLLGAGFMLMETQLVSRLALYFGTTWLVNCVAISGILSVLLLANFYVRLQRPQKLSLYYICLCAALLVDFGVPWDKVPGSGTFVGILICFAYCVPICIAGIIFTENFRRFAGRSDAFGANMLGAVAGGLAQNLSFLFGLKALLLVAAAAYGLAAILDGVKPPRVLSMGR